MNSAAISASLASGDGRSIRNPCTIRSPPLLKLTAASSEARYSVTKGSFGKSGSARVAGTTMDGWREVVRRLVPAIVRNQMKVIGGRVRLAASDVANFLACQRLTQLDLLRARGELRPPREFDVGFEELVRRGEVHERAVLERFRADGLDVVEISAAEDGAGATAEAIRDSVGVVYQGTLTGGPGAALFGRPDFLIRADLLPAPDGEPRPDRDHYEVVDARR